MKIPILSRFSAFSLIMLMALSGTAAAHPGGHGAATGHSISLSGLMHYLTHIDHVGPVIACLLLIYVLRRRQVAGTAVPVLGTRCRRHG